MRGHFSVIPGRLGSGKSHYWGEEGCGVISQSSRGVWGLVKATTRPRKAAGSFLSHPGAFGVW